MTYSVRELVDVEEDDAWEAQDWRFTVVDENDEIMCICSTQEEADKIMGYLNDPRNQDK